MSNHMYGYGSSYGGAAGSYGQRENPYLSDAARYGVSGQLSAAASAGMYGSSLYSNQTDLYGLPSSVGAGGYGGAAAPPPYSQNPWSAAAADPTAGAKRSADALYHQNVLGGNTIGQTEALFSTNPLIKRPRYDIASSLPIYPQRPGEKDCPHYMLTRACKFGESCKFDHPVWVPEGGVPDWKEIQIVPNSESLPERPGEPDCPYYMKTQKCKFGLRCKFNHPKDKLNISSGGEVMESIDKSELPERPSEPICSFYAKTGLCKFGATCKFHHPKDIQIPPAGQDSGNAEQGVNGRDAAGGDTNPIKTFVPFTAALLHNSKGLPIRPGETDCPFYIKTGSCKFGATCRFNHPERAIIPPVLAPLGHSVMPSNPANFPIGVYGTAANILPNAAQALLGVTSNTYPQRPGLTECDYYMKSGHCSFGERCKFHHPIDRTTPTATAKHGLVPNVKLTLAGLPRREGSVACPFYMKTGICKYGATCKYDHPPPGEAVALANVQGAGTTATAGEEEIEALDAEDQ